MPYPQSPGQVARCGNVNADCTLIRLRSSICELCYCPRHRLLLEEFQVNRDAQRHRLLQSLASTSAHIWELCIAADCYPMRGT